MKLSEYRIVESGYERRLAVVSYDPESPSWELRFVPTFGCQSPEDTAKEITEALTKPPIIWSVKD